ncbi:MAG: methyltransferase domain-containing protein [Thiogranum sp.]|nr:methyltransferase domain-containing protein [Thiogranum sp.]
MIHLLLATLCAPCGPAVADSPLQSAAGAFGPGDVRTLNPDRETWYRRYQIIAATGVQPGMRVASISACSDVFTSLFSQRVGASGKVYAVTVAGTPRSGGGENVERMVSKPGDAGLPPHSLDLAFLCDAYHRFEQPRAMLQSIRDALRPGGRMIVVDYRRIPGVSPVWVMGEIPVGEAAVMSEIEAVGFRLVEDNDLLEFNYLLVFESAQ